MSLRASISFCEAAEGSLNKPGMSECGDQSDERPLNIGLRSVKAKLG